MSGDYQEKKTPNLREISIAWDAEERRPRRTSRDGDRERSRSRRGLSRSSNHGRSASRDSIRSVQSRAQNANAGVPIEFRTLSFGVAQSRSRAVDEFEKHPRVNHDGEEKSDVTNEFAKADQHAVGIDALYQRLRVSPAQGLTSDSAGKRLAQDGPNVLPQRKKNYLFTLLGYIFGGFCSILWIGVIIFFICWRPLGDPDPAPYNLGLAILVLIVIFLQACFSAFQDWSTTKTMNSILDMLPSDAHVFRDGSWVAVPTSNVVVGDIVRIKIGDKVPADLRLVETSGDVRFDRSAMTGESEEVEGALDMTDDNFLESRNIALMGTIVTNGSATGIVIFTGAKSVMGGIARATSQIKDKPTAIQREITRFVIIIVGLTVILAALILFTWVGWLRVDHGQFMNVVDMLDDVMGCVVAFIPEGMPVAVALTLMMIARRMKAADVLPKSLATVEMLGCVNVICSDKTGTLTENKMRVTSVGFLDESMTADEAREKTANSTALTQLHRAARLCIDASFDPLSKSEPIEERLTQGNATDGAVLRFAEGANPGSDVVDANRQVAQIPFNSKNKFMLTLHEDEEALASEKSDSTSYLTLVKGAPDVLLPRCTSYMSYKQNKILPLDHAAMEMFTQLQTDLSRRAERVILFCQRRYHPVASLGSNDLSRELMERSVSDLTIVGVLGIFDPPRPETAKTVADCRRAGIRFFMMTGDFGMTGAAIARQVGIFTGDRAPDTYAIIEERRLSLSSESLPTTEYSNQSLLLEGNQISDLKEQDWDVVCQYEEIVFGRCSPEHKLIIVRALQKRGMATAVTGDGVNDAPALKAADVGVAIASGSDVALEAADLVLLNKFSSIVEGIRLGRLVFQNLQKVISYLLPAGSWSEIWPVLFNVFLGVPLPLSSFLMIIICVFTDLFVSLALIMEKEEFDLLSLPPRNHKKDHLINLRIYIQSYLFIGVMEAIVAHSMYFLYYWRHAGIPASALFFAFEKYSAGFYGYTEAELTNFNVVGQSVYFVTLVILQWGNVLSIRNKRLSILQADPIRKQRRNPWLIPAAIIALCIAIFVTEEPGLQKLFGTGSVPIEFWLIPLPLAIGILMMDEIRKLAVRTWPKGPIAWISW